MEINLKTTEDSFSSSEVAKPKEKRRYKMQSIQIDKLNVLRKRVLLTPSMCLKANCNFDIATANKFTGWDDVPTEERSAMLKALQKHVEEVHSIAEESIIDEDLMPKNYLGSSRTF